MSAPRLIHGPVEKTIISLTLPLLGGIYAMITFTLVDTYFVSRLGISALAAISFTFPVAMVLIYFVVGVGVGTAAIVAMAIGEENPERMRRFATDGLMLGILFVAAQAVVGLLTIDPLFRFLGARGEVLSLVRQYMSVWYIAIAFFTLSMIMNSIIRAAGDAKFPGIVMMLSALINLILDPVLIFGIGPVPALGIQGAAWATLIAFVLSSAALLVRQMQHKLVTWTLPTPRECWESWRQILYIGLPSGLTNVIINIALAFVIRLLSGFGDAAVAGFGIATRIEELSLAIFHAMGGAIAPFTGQNWGAKKFERLHQGLQFSFKSSLFIGLALAGVLALTGRFIAGIFDKNPEVVRVAALYLLIVPVTYAARGIIMMVTTTLNALGRPIPATAISLARTFALYVPLAYLGQALFGIVGIFVAAFLANAVAGVGTLLWQRNYFNGLAPIESA